MKSKILIMSLLIAIPFLGNLQGGVEYVNDPWGEADYFYLNILDEVDNHDTNISRINIAEGNNSQFAWSNSLEKNDLVFHIWNIDDGLKTIDLSLELARYEYEIESPGINPIYIDSNENIFIKIPYSIQINTPNTTGKLYLSKLGIWHKDHDFRIINIPEIKSISRVTFKDEFIVIEGTTNYDMHKPQYKIVVIQNPVALPKVEEPVDDEQPFWKIWWPFTCKLNRGSGLALWHLRTQMPQCQA